MVVGIAVWTSLVGGRALAADMEVDGLTVVQDGQFMGKVEVIQGTAVSNSMKLYFAFQTDESGVVTDLSGNGNTGVVNGAVWTTNGAAEGGAYDFDGTNDYIACASSASLNITNYLTMAAWVRFDGEGSGNHVFLTKHRSGALQYGMLRYASGGGSTHEFAALLGTPGGSHSDYVSDYLLDDDVWYFLGATYDGTNVSLFVNGVIAKTCSRSGAIAGDATDGLDIGREHQWNEYANAIVDEVRIYDWALSAAEMKGLYNSCLSNYSTNLLLDVEGTARIQRLLTQGDIEMGVYTNGQ